MIEIVSGKSERDNRLGGKKSRSAARQSDDVTFDTVLSSAVEKETERGIDALMNDLSEQERRFIDAQSLFELNKYKILLQKLLKTLIDDSYETHSIPRKRRDRADYQIITVINDKVDQLARTVASSDNKAFMLMKTLEEIRGLICDLRH
jgi:uncharacterized protein